MFFVSKLLHILARFRKQLFIFLTVLGPGVIVLVADNDAGGISTYAVTGSKYGFSLLWVILILLPMAYFVQEMTVRLGAVTKRGHAEAIFEGFGPRWGWFSLIDLAIGNWLTLVTEYIGMIIAMKMFGVPPVVTFIGVTAVLLGIVITGSYWTFERLTLFFCAFNFVYIPAAFWAMKLPQAPGWDAVFRGMFLPSFHGGFSGEMLFFILANVGTTIAPWQIYFQQSSVVDKGLDFRDIKFGKIDTLFGAFFTCSVAAFIIITTGAAFFYHQPPILVEDAAQTAQAITPLFPGGKGKIAHTLFAIGLFDAGFLGALCISLSSSWAVGEVFGWAHSLNKSVREAPSFYIYYALILATAGGVVLIPGAPLITITMFVQIAAVTLLPSSLIFLVILLNDRDTMGEFTNTPLQNAVNITIIVFVIAMSSLFALTTLFPGFFDALFRRLL